jgi:hypothetical protein
MLTPQQKRYIDLGERFASKEMQSYLALGFSTQGWAALEIGLDVCNAAISEFLPRQPFPVSLSRKMVMYRKGHNQLPVLAPVKEAGLAIADEVQLLADKRHDVIHGFAIKGLSGDIVRLYRHTVPREAVNNHVVRATRKEYRSEDLKRLTSDILALSERALLHTNRVLELCGWVEKARNLGRQFSV